MAETNEGDAARLVEFLKDRDAPCPLCGYNLRGLEADVCPECRQPLRLTVGLQHVRFGWFLATAAPGVFSGIAGVLLGILLAVGELVNAGPVPPVAYLLVLIGMASGAVALVLILRRQRFIRKPPHAQRNWALLAWSIHALPFIGLVILLIATS